MDGEKRSFLRRAIFGDGAGSEREQKVLAYVCHRVGDGAHLEDVVREEYVRRNASPSEIEGILANPKLIKIAHEKMRDDFSSGGKLDLKKPALSAAR